MAAVIVGENLVKTFKAVVHTKNRVRDFLLPKHRDFTAVDGVSLEINEGEVFGLLGPNGAGKTTLVKLLCGLIQPSSGSVLVYGRPPEESKQRLNVMLGHSMIYRRITGYDNLKFFARLYNIADVDDRIHAVCGICDIGGWVDDLVETYSLGMKIRLCLARALINDPDVIFLDEPTEGLDPRASKEIRKKIRGLGKTIVLTTHDMEEADYLSDTIALIDKGKIVEMGDKEQIKGKYGEKSTLTDVFLSATKK